jgi:hypothetical protein
MFVSKRRYPSGTPRSFTVNAVQDTDAETENKCIRYLTSIPETTLETAKEGTGKRHVGGGGIDRFPRQPLLKRLEIAAKRIPSIHAPRYFSYCTDTVCTVLACLRMGVNFQPSAAPVVIVEDHDSDVSCIKCFDSAAPLGSQVTPFRQRYASAKRAKAQQNDLITGILAVECPRHEAVVPRRVRTKWISRWSCYCREQQRSWTPAVGGFCFELWEGGAL